MGLGFSLLQDGDVDLLTEMLSEREILRNLKSLTYPYARETAVAFVREIQAQKILGLAALEGTNESGKSCWGLTYQGRLVGTLGFRIGQGVEEGDFTLGYWLGKDYWGQGIATQAVERACRWALGPARARRISAHVFAWNPASSRVLEKNGFQLEGCKRKAVVRFGEVTDLLTYGLLPEDFQTTKMKA